jgi:succinate dehydrogenase / fumarate reductase cytochrome b subunit
MTRLMSIYRSTIGKKIIMSVTGLIGIVFVLAHMLGNLQAFSGPAKLNAYAHFLHGPAAELLWVMRVVLILAVIFHVLMAWQLRQQSNSARPLGYLKTEPQVSTWSARTMRWGGVLLLVFIVFHILHFTTGTIRPAGFFQPGNVYANIVGSFHVWWVTVFYLVAMVFLGLHLYHGAWASVRTLGYARPSPRPLHRRIALVVAVVIWLGFTLVPVGVVVGILR